MADSMSEISNKIRAGNRRAIGKAITLIESSRPDHQKEAQDLLSELLPYTGCAMRIGITGVPGVGKSTFIESFGKMLTKLDIKVAVLAVDPSSKFLEDQSLVIKREWKSWPVMIWLLFALHLLKQLSEALLVILVKLCWYWKLQDTK